MSEQSGVAVKNLLESLGTSLSIPQIRSSREKMNTPTTMIPNPNYYTPEVASELHIDLLTGQAEERLFPPLSRPISEQVPRYIFLNGEWVKKEPDSICIL